MARTPYLFVHEIDIGSGYVFSTGPILVAGEIVEPRIADPGRVVQSSIAAGRLPGMLPTNLGDCVYINTDGSLDLWFSLAISGAQIICYYGPEGGSFPSDFEVEFIAYIDGAPRGSRVAERDGVVDLVTISLRDRTNLFAAPAVQRGFLQTGGMEGSEVAGARLRQRIHGQPGYISPILIDPFETGLNAWYLMQQEETGALILYDGGVALAEGTPYATEADFLDDTDDANPGEWRRWYDSDEGFFVRLGSRVYVDLRFNPDTDSDTITDLAIEAGVTDAATMADSDCVDLSLGSRVIETQTFAAVLADVCRANLSIIGFDRTDRLLQRYLRPSTDTSYSTDVVLVEGENCDELEIVAPGGFERRVWKVRVRTGATKPGQLAGIPDLSPAAAETLSRDRWTAEFSGVSDETHDEDSSAEVLDIEIEANDFAGAPSVMADYVASVLSLFGGVQMFFWVTVPYGEADLRALKILDRVTFRARGGRFNTGSGRACRVVSIERRLAGDVPTIRLCLWSHYTEPDDVALVEVNDATAATSFDSTGSQNVRREPPYVIACSPIGSNITVGLLQVVDPWPVDYLLGSVEGGLSVAQASGSIFRFDIKVDTVSLFSTKPTIDNTELTTETAATPSVLSKWEIPKGSRVEFYADQVGTAGAQGLKVTLKGVSA